MPVTIRKTQPVELYKYIDANYNVGLAHYDHAFVQRKLSSSDLFYLFIFCILVPGGKASRAKEAVEILKKKDFYHQVYTGDTLYSLIKHLVRFPVQKIDRILNLKLRFPAIERYVRQAKDTAQETVTIRDYLVQNVPGLGYKAASHVLRNTGSLDIAIIDTHILKYAKYFLPGFRGDKAPAPKSRKAYLDMEFHFFKWAMNRFNLPPVVLDWFIWTFESGYKVDEFDC